MEQGLYRSVPVRPAPGQVLAAGLGSRDQLGPVPDSLVLLADRDEIIDLGLGHRCPVAHLPEAVGFGILLEHLHRQADKLGNRLGPVVIAHDPAGDSRGPGTDPPLVEHQHAGAALGQRPANRESVDPAAYDDVGGQGVSQLQG